MGSMVALHAQGDCLLSNANNFCSTCNVGGGTDIVSPDGLISGTLQLNLTGGTNARFFSLPFSCPGEGTGELRLGALTVVFVQNNNRFTIPRDNLGGDYPIDPSAVGFTLVGRSSGTSTFVYKGELYTKDSGANINTLAQGEDLVRADAAAAPIELLSWTATPQSTGVALAWASASEVDNDFYTIEHSTDGSTFRELTRIPGSAASEQVIAYGYLHMAPGIGTHYYRLAQQDLDGTRTTFDVLAVTVGTEAAATSVSPNPARAGTTVTLGSLVANDDISLLRIDGSLVAHYPAASRDLPQVTLPADLPAGIYLVRMGAEVSRLLVR